MTKNYACDIVNSYRFYRNYDKFDKFMNQEENNEAKNILSAKDIIRIYHITYQTVNHYTDFGLLPVLMKKGKVRLYDAEIVDKRLKQIEELKREGYSLRLIRKKLIGI